MPDVHVSPAARVNTLKIEVVLPEDGSDFPQVKFMIDGTDRLKNARRTGFEGFLASQLLVDTSVLMPAAEPRRVALYQCSCGDPGCGSLAPIISVSDGNRVVWTDFRNFTGVFESPLRLSDPHDDDSFSQGEAANVPDLVFDRSHYESEVEQAVTDRSWESDVRRADRLIAEAIRVDEAERLGHAGLALRGVWSQASKRGTLSVTIDLHPTVRRPERGPYQQILLDAKASPGTPDEQAVEVLAKLRAIPVDAWESTFRHKHWMPARHSRR